MLRGSGSPAGNGSQQDLLDKIPEADKRNDGAKESSGVSHQDPARRVRFQSRRFCHSTVGPAPGQRSHKDTDGQGSHCAGAMPEPDFIDWLTETIRAPASVELRRPVAMPLALVIAPGCTSVFAVPVAPSATARPAIGLPFEIGERVDQPGLELPVRIGVSIVPGRSERVVLSRLLTKSSASESPVRSGPNARACGLESSDVGNRSPSSGSSRLAAISPPCS